MARVLVFAPGVPHRIRGASNVLFYHYLRQLVLAGDDVLCVLLLEGEEDVSVLRTELRDCGRFDAVAAVVQPLLRFAKYSGKAMRGALPEAVLARARGFDADVVLYFDIGCLAVAGHLGGGARRVAWLGDLAFESIWHHALYDARESWRAIPALPKIWLICRRWASAYRRFLAGVDEVIVASWSSEAVLRKLGIVARYLPYPWPVDRRFRSAARNRVQGDKPRFLFCGTLSGLGSRSAMHYLLDALYPELCRRWGRDGFEVLVTGTRSLAPWAMKSIARKPEIRFEGFVEDLYARMDHCHAAIVPIDVPVGNRSRIVTAMGYGLLVIAHPSTAMGNPALISGKTCLLADSPATFADQMLAAYEDAGLCARIEAAAREAYEQLFEPSVAARALSARIVGTA